MVSFLYALFLAFAFSRQPIKIYMNENPPTCALQLNFTLPVRMGLAGRDFSLKIPFNVSIPLRWVLVN